MSLDENSSIPLYYQLENLIREKIKNNEYKIGEKIPSERVLSEQYKVSRLTVSKAISTLVENGVLVRKRGLGTFVSEKKIEFFPGLSGFNDIMKNKGFVPSSKVISQELVLPSKLICEKLNISSEDKVVLTIRLRLADEQIVGLEKSYIPYSICSNLMNIDLSQNSIYEQLRNEDYNPTRAVEEINAILCDESLSETLEINPGEAVLKRDRITYSKETPVEFSYSFYRGDKYSMCITVKNTY